MANTLLTPVQITREALRVLHNNLVFVKGVNRQYNDEFAKAGAKIGSTVNIRKPNRYFVRKGAAMQTQGTTETYVPLQLNNQWGTDISFSSTELTLSLDDFSKRILTPAMAKIASQIDADCLQGVITGSMVGAGGALVATGSPVFNIIGTPGTTPGTPGGAATGLSQYNAPICYLNAGMQMDNAATPRDENRRVIMSPAAMAQSVAGLAGLYNDGVKISDQYRKGVIGTALGFEFAMDQNVYALTTPALTTGTLSAALVNGVATAAVTGAGTSLTVPAGAIFTISGVFAVNPENQISTGQLQQFVVTAATALSGAGAGTLPIYPAPLLAASGVATGTIATATGDFTGSSTGGNTSSPITWATNVSGTGGTFQQSISYHQDAFTFATADLELPSGVDFAGREVYDGISMRIVRAFDITNDQFPCRIDVLGGFANLRPEMACRITG